MLLIKSSPQIGAHYNLYMLHFRVDLTNNGWNTWSQSKNRKTLSKSLLPMIDPCFWKASTIWVKTALLIDDLDNLKMCIHTRDMGKCGCFFPRDKSRFSRQVAQFRRSWSSGKILVFQPRGFEFEPVRMRYFFTRRCCFQAVYFDFFRHSATFPKIFKCVKLVVKKAQCVPFFPSLC